MIRAEVAWFAKAMERELCNNDHKAGWADLTLRRLMQRLEQEAAELRRAIERAYAADAVIAEAADVANFAMMIADTVARLEKDA
jgi:NTP pyrophosphatase (non-canonical NTP hydrolase)